MEANDRLVLWATGQRALGQLDFEIVPMTWCQSLGVELSDVEIILRDRASEHFGRGTSSNEKLAVTIAFSEAFERVLAGTLETGSNGLAAHSSFAEASRSAQNELIERDAFLVSYLCGTPLVALEIERLSPACLTSLKYLNLYGQSIQLFGLAKSYGRFAVMCVVSGLGESAIGSAINVGLGCETDLAHACEKAAMEAIRNGIWATDPKTEMQATTLEHFLSLSQFSPHDHLALSLDPKFGAQILRELRERPKVMEFVSLPEIGEFLFHEPIWPPHIPKPPLHIVKCDNERLQSVFWGPSLNHKLNAARLSSVSENWQTRIKFLPPHPLG